MVLKWGICCVGLISQDFTSALLEYKSPLNDITAVAASNINKAKKFADRFKIEHHFGDYEALAKFNDIDIVYIGSIHPEHCRLTKLFLNHGKHVLVEKPMAMNVKETTEMIELAKEKKLFLMEGMWSACLPLFKDLQDISNNGTIGSIMHINANFQVNISDVDRVRLKELGGGGLLDIGIYVLEFAIFMFRGKKIIKSQSNLKWENDVDVCGSIVLHFENEGTAFLTYHTAVDADTSASIYGDSGNIKIPDTFWSSEVVFINDKLDQSMKLERKDQSFTYNFVNSWYFIHEINHVNECIEKGLLESYIHPHSTTLQLAELMEKFLSNKE